MSYIGIIGVSRLDSENRLDFARAEQMAQQGCDPTAIKIQTGWEMGIDGYWRYEVIDPFMPSEAIEDYVKPRFGESIDIGMLLVDKTILAAYPEFQTLTLYAMYSPRKGTAGYYRPATNGMVVSMGSPSDQFEYQTEAILLHEIQHLIQEIEGFAKGGSPESVGRRRYMRLAGEVEARNVCFRHGLTAEERRRTLRTATQDISDNEQIILF